ncbi:carbohydrate ABC transporter permease [Micromonospora sp. 067-2]|uniref:carbohydrate ABC transporter permease n=1 Tax=Micromonospora sp. 067-2 TaxID=2789270 RepID=UPI00397ABC60
MRASRLPLLIVAGAAATLFLLPLLWLLDISLKAPGELSAIPVHWLPSEPLWSNFRDAVSYVDFLGYARNSLAISVLYATFASLSSALVGFAMARLEAPGKRALFAVMMATLMLPQIVTLIPTYLLFAKFGMVDTYWPWLLWGAAGSAYLVFLFRQFFAGLPAELEDAAVIDGCGYVRMFWQIFLPLAKPALATSFVLAFVFTWGDWITPTLLLSQDRSTLSVAVTDLYVNPQGQPINQLMAAGAILYTLPVLVIYLFMQRSFVRGFATSGIK